MIRTVIVLLYFSLAMLLVLPFLVLWTILTGDANFMYHVFVQYGLRIGLRIAGIRVRVEGLENVPPGVCIFASNHASNLDPIALTPQIPRRVALLAKKEVFRIPVLANSILRPKLISIVLRDSEAVPEV